MCYYFLMDLFVPGFVVGGLWPIYEVVWFECVLAGFLDTMICVLGNMVQIMFVWGLCIVVMLYIFFCFGRKKKRGIVYVAVFVTVWGYVVDSKICDCWSCVVEIISGLLILKLCGWWCLCWYQLIQKNVCVGIGLFEIENGIVGFLVLWNLGSMPLI